MLLTASILHPYLFHAKSILIPRLFHEFLSDTFSLPDGTTQAYNYPERLCICIVSADYKLIPRLFKWTTSVKIFENRRKPRPNVEKLAQRIASELRKKNTHE